MTVVGITPQGFARTSIGIVPTVYVPISMRAMLNPSFHSFTERSSYWIYVFGRLKPGISMERASRQLNAGRKLAPVRATRVQSRRYWLCGRRARGRRVLRRLFAGSQSFARRPDPGFAIRLIPMTADVCETLNMGTHPETARS